MIVFVEGVPFSGKSTLSEFLAEQMNAQGIPAEWVSEGAMLERFFPRVRDSFETSAPVPISELRKEWAAFATAARLGETWVIDSAISYAGIHPLMQSMALAEIPQAWAQIRPDLDARVIHLLTEPRIAVPTSIEERGAAWRQQLLKQGDQSPYQRQNGLLGLDGVITQMIDHQKATSRSLATGPWPLLSLQSPGPGWSENRQLALDFLGLRWTESNIELESSVLDRCTGEFATDSGQRLTVIKSEGGLVLFEPDSRLGPLVPRTNLRFHLQASDLDLEFDPEGALLTLISRYRPPRSYRRV